MWKRKFLSSCCIDSPLIIFFFDKNAACVGFTVGSTTGCFGYTKIPTTFDGPGFTGLTSYFKRTDPNKPISLPGSSQRVCNSTNCICPFPSFVKANGECSPVCDAENS